MKSKQRTSGFLGTFTNTSENVATIADIRHQLRLGGFKGRIQLYGRGRNRRRLWEELERPTTALHFFRPPLARCERFDAYISIPIKSRLAWASGRGSKQTKVLNPS